MSGTAPIPAGEIILVPVAEVATGERLRPVDRVWAEALGRVMVREGQQTPIEVCKLPGKTGWMLVAGAHRLTGAAIVGMEMIEAREVSNAAAHRKLREVSENLWRRDLAPVDRAAFIAELVTLQKLRAGIDPAKDGRAASADARWKKAVKAEAADANATIAVAYGWADEIGDQLGLSRRTIEYDLMLYRRLAPSLVERLRAARHPVLGNASQLRALAKLDAAEQAIIVARLLGEGTGAGGIVPRTVAQAIAMGTNKPPRAAEDARLSAFLGAFARMSLAEKKGALAHLAAQLPAGFELVEGRRA